MEKYTVTVQLTKEGLKINDNLCKVINRGKVVVIENYSTGGGHSAHANIDISGSIKGMKKMGYWGKNDVTHKQGGFIYNLSTQVISDPLDALALFIEKGFIFNPPTKIDEWNKTQFTFSI